MKDHNGKEDPDFDLLHRLVHQFRITLTSGQKTSLAKGIARARLTPGQAWKLLELVEENLLMWGLLSRKIKMSQIKKVAQEIETLKKALADQSDWTCPTPEDICSVADWEKVSPIFRQFVDFFMGASEPKMWEEIFTQNSLTPQQLRLFLDTADNFMVLCGQIKPKDVGRHKQDLRELRKRLQREKPDDAED